MQRSPCTIGTIAIVLVSMSLHLLLGFRGLWKEDHDFFAMKPFSDPVMTCIVRIMENGALLPFPSATYVRVPAATFTGRPYLETLPLHAEGLRTFLQATHPQARVEILCQAQHGPEKPLYHFHTQ